MTSTRYIRQDQRGQAMVEFALIAPLFLLIVAGIIQFGVALNFWLDEQRIANQGARWAVVNQYPGCPRTGPNSPCNPTLQQYLASEPVSGANTPTVTICFPSGTSKAGDPVTVRLQQPFSLLPILDIGQITLGAEATMRLEQKPGRYTGVNGC